MSNGSSGSGSGSGSGGGMVFNNCLMANVSTLFSYVANKMPGVLSLNNCTVDRNSSLFTTTSPYRCNVSSYNSIFANVTNSPGADYSGQANAFYCSTQFGGAVRTLSTPPFQSVGAGGYYLSDSSGLRNAGTSAGVPGTLVADLKDRTTYPPVELSNVTFTVNTTLQPQAQRDKDVLDVGYHYDPIDYITALVTCDNATLTITNGTVIAYYYTDKGIWLKNNAQMVSEGTPAQHNCFALYSAVQEQPVRLGNATNQTTYPLVASNVGGGPIPGSFRFSDFFCMAGLLRQPGLDDSYGNWDPLTFRDCSFAGGALYLGTVNARTAIVENNLFERCNFSCENSPIVTLHNNLFRNSTNWFVNLSDTPWVIKDNAFDNCFLAVPNDGLIDHGNNAYINSARLLPTNTNDVVVPGFSYVTGTFGNYYQPGNVLWNKGSRSASDAGLFHYTTMASQLKETNSVVDIGLHYVAANTSKQPMDSEGDGVPDYLEDFNGDGNSAGDATSWELYNSANGLTSGKGLQLFTPLK